MGNFLFDLLLNFFLSINEFSADDLLLCYFLDLLQNKCFIFEGGRIQDGFFKMVLTSGKLKEELI